MILCLVVLFLFISIAISQAAHGQQRPGSWVLAGMRYMEKVPGCNNRAYKASTHWIFRDNAYPQKLDSLRKTNTDAVRPDISTFPSTSYNWVAVVRKRIECKNQWSYNFKGGKTKEDVIKQLEWDKANIVDVEDYAIEQWLDIKAEVAKLGVPLPANSSTASKEVFTAYYNTLKVDYIIGRLASGRSVTHVKIVNTGTLPAGIVFYVDKAPASLKTPSRTYLGKFQLMPGEKVNHVIHTDEFSVMQGDLGPVPLTKTKSVTDEIIDRMKNMVRDQVTTKDGKITRKLTSVGVRG